VSTSILSELVRQPARDDVSPLGLTDNGPAFSEGEVVLCKDWRHAHKVGVLQFLRGIVLSISLVQFDLIWNLKLLLG